MVKTKKTRIEIEFRSRFAKEKYTKLKRFLDKKAELLGPDDKDVYFFTFPDKLLKVVDNVSKDNAKIVLKMNRIGNGSNFEEFEIPISRHDVKKTVKVFKLLGFTKLMMTPQKRINYLYKGVELALKYSTVWGYHLELEVLIKNIKQKATVELKIRAVADELEVKLMSEEELKNFVDSIDRERK